MRTMVHVRAAAALTVLLGVVLAVTGAGGAAGATAGTMSWAPVGAATIRPGVQMYTDGSQCTGNFVFTDRRGRVYVGYAAHCAGLGSSTDTNGCTTPSLPLGTRVTFRSGGSLLSDGDVVGKGRLVYSSWLTMQKRGTRNAARCQYNDFALVRVGKAHRRKVNPTVPHWGGPTGLRSTDLSAGTTLATYGSSSLRAGVGSAKTARVLRAVGRGLAYEIDSANPGVPGDSGSGFLDPRGRAVGVLSTVSVGVSLTPVTNTIGDLYDEVVFARKHSGILELKIAKGTQPFRG